MLMCGIVGVVSQKNVKAMILRGLENLEYRGYDSAGIYLNNHKEQADVLVKRTGRVENLKEAVEQQSIQSGESGIGHTRWATHGKPEEVNAHPHTSHDGRFVLVHNGVIENYLAIKEKYVDDIPLKGETDTEIMVNWLAKLVALDCLSPKQALAKMMANIEGSYAFAIIDRENPSELLVAKHKSPLLVAVGKSFNGVSSDALALLDYTTDFYEIMDEEIVTVTKDAVVIENLEGTKMIREMIHYEPSEVTHDLGTYSYYMQKEIEEQPLVMRQLIAHYRDENGQIAIDQAIVEQLSNADRIFIVACGTSYHAGLVGKVLIEKLAKVPVEVHVASEFGYHTPLLPKRPAFIFLSQSGETADSRQVLVKAMNEGHYCLTITNVKGSTLSREASHTLLLHAGPEIAVASTKAYTAQVALLAILGEAMGKQAAYEQALMFDVFHELSIVAQAMESFLESQDVIAELVDEMLTDKAHAFYIGRGTDYGVALEAALKLKEISYIHCEGFASGELKHGTIALIEEGTPVIAIISEKVTEKQVRSNLKEVESRGARTATIVMDELAQSNDDIVLPTVHPLLTPLISVLPTQLIAYYATLARGFDVDKPRNLAKSVTVE